MAIANPEVEFHLPEFVGECEYNKHVWFFVSKEDGLIWKPASYKAPARNFPRGNILEDKAKDVIGVYGL
jgi:hypothetical protein